MAGHAQQAAAVLRRTAVLHAELTLRLAVVQQDTQQQPADRAVSRRSSTHKPQAVRQSRQPPRYTQTTSSKTRQAPLKTQTTGSDCIVNTPFIGSFVMICAKYTLVFKLYPFNKKLHLLCKQHSDTTAAVFIERQSPSLSTSYRQNSSSSTAIRSSNRRPSSVPSYSLQAE